VGRFEAGITGLDDAFEAAARDARPPDDPALGPALVEALRAAGNYIPVLDEAAYAEAFVRLYLEFIAEKSQSSRTTVRHERSTTMKVEILGPGCARCRATEENVRKALAELKLEAEVVHVTDVIEFAKRGVMLTPGVLIDGAVRSSGRVPTVEEIKRWLQPAPAPR